MHVQTHLMSGWCVGNLFRLTPRERMSCMAAASLADLDGLSIVGGQDCYQKYHHLLCHGLPFGIVVSLALTLFSRRRLATFFLFLALFHLHLVMDYFGSGPFWPIYYLWPFSWHEIMNPRAWNLYSWQNLTAAAMFLGWTVWIAVRLGRTPLEAIMPRLDTQLVQWLRKRFRYTGSNAPVDSVQGDASTRV